jgi:alkylhydroperoxidase family enzyme
MTHATATTNTDTTDLDNTKSAAHGEQEASIRAFERAYNYDATYMRRLLQSSPEGFARFGAFQPMGHFRETLPIDAYHTAKLAVMRVEDCGPCLQFCVQMALQDELSPELVRAAVDGGDGLPPELAEVYRFAQAVARGEPADSEAMEERYGAAGVAELALAIAAARVYPTVKRAMGLAKSCARITIAV